MELRIRLHVAVQPGCTNRGLVTLLCSRTNANDESSHWSPPGSGKDRIQMDDGERCAHANTRRTQGEPSTSIWDVVDPFPVHCLATAPFQASVLRLSAAGIWNPLSGTQPHLLEAAPRRSETCYVPPSAQFAPVVSLALDSYVSREMRSSPRSKYTLNMIAGC